MKNFFKSIWNFFFRKKKTIELGCDGLPRKKEFKIIAVDIDKTCVYCLGEKQMEFNGRMIDCPDCEGTGKYTIWAKIKEPSSNPEAIGKKLFKPQTQLFRKQQLSGKILNIGKSRFRIKKKLGLTESEKLRYEITQL